MPFIIEKAFVNDLKTNYPVRDPLFYGGMIPSSFNRFRKAKDQSFVLSNRAYSNRLDQAGLDSPPFDEVKAL